LIDNSTRKNSSEFTKKINKDKHNISFSTSDYPGVGNNNSKLLNQTNKKEIVKNEQ